MNTANNALPTCDEPDRLDQQRPVLAEEAAPDGTLPRWDANERDLIDQAIPAPLPDDEYRPGGDENAAGFDRYPAVDADPAE